MHFCACVMEITYEREPRSRGVRGRPQEDLLGGKRRGGDQAVAAARCWIRTRASWPSTSFDECVARHAPGGSARGYRNERSVESAPRRRAPRGERTADRGARGRGPTPARRLLTGAAHGDGPRFLTVSIAGRRGVYFPVLYTRRFIFRLYFPTPPSAYVIHMDAQVPSSRYRDSTRPADTAPVHSNTRSLAPRERDGRSRSARRDPVSHARAHHAHAHRHDANSLQAPQASAVAGSAAAATVLASGTVSTIADANSSKFAFFSMSHVPCSSIPPPLPGGKQLCDRHLLDVGVRVEDLCNLFIDLVEGSREEVICLVRHRFVQGLYGEACPAPRSIIFDNHSMPCNLAWLSAVSKSLRLVMGRHVGR